jgi:excisionase family DNA binding protein
MTENYCTTREAAKLLGVSLRTAQQWLEKGTLEGWKTSGGHRRITRSSVMRALLEHAHGKKMPPHPYALPVLIIEDDVSLLKLYRAQISRWPFAVSLYTAPNGYEGLVMVGEMRPQLLICDLRLPGINGFHLVRSLCMMERYQSLKIVVVSGLPANEIEAHGGLPERVEIMGKPVDFARLRALANTQYLSHSTANLQPETLPEEK